MSNKPILTEQEFQRLLDGCWTPYGYMVPAQLRERIIQSAPRLFPTYIPSHTAGRVAPLKSWREMKLSGGYKS